MIDQQETQNLIAQNKRLIEALALKDTQIRRLDSIISNLTKMVVESKNENQPLIKVNTEYLTEQEFKERKSIHNPTLKNLFEDVAQNNHLLKENKELKDLIQYLLNELSETNQIAKEKFNNILHKLS